MENNNEELNQETEIQDDIENTNFEEVELNPTSLDDMPEEERNAMILKFSQDKIANEILRKYIGKQISPEIIEEVVADVSEIFNGLKCDAKQNDGILN